MCSLSWKLENGAAWMHKELLRSNVVASFQISRGCKKLNSEWICQINENHYCNKGRTVKWQNSYYRVCVLWFVIFYLFIEKINLKSIYCITAIKKSISYVPCNAWDFFSSIWLDNWSTVNNVMSLLDIFRVATVYWSLIFFFKHLSYLPWM